MAPPITPLTSNKMASATQNRRRKDRKDAERKKREQEMFRKRGNSLARKAEELARKAKCHVGLFFIKSGKCTTFTSHDDSLSGLSFKDLIVSSFFERL
jgi:hypothetical protein